MSRDRSPEFSSNLDRRRFLKTVGVGAAGLALGAATGADVFAEENAKPPTDQVKQRPLGRTGIQSSIIIYGCGGLGTQHLPLLSAARDHGVNTYDVAWTYGRGQAEVAVGKFVSTLKDRKSIHIITKASGFKPQGTAKEVYRALKASIGESLKRLQTDYIDVLYYPHGATKPAQFRNEAMNEALAKIKEEKLVKHLGASSHTNYTRVAGAAIKDSHCEVFMPVANICTQNAAVAGMLQGRRGKRGRPTEDTTGILQAAAQKKIGIVAMKVANKGYLTGQTDALLAKVFPTDSKLSRHQKLYTYMLKQQGVSAVVVGIYSAAHLREALAVGKQA